jgi:hypothetical protein
VRRAICDTTIGIARLRRRACVLGEFLIAFALFFDVLANDLGIA